MSRSTAHPSKKEEVVQTGNFTPLDVIGISLSTLLFALVWVGVFYVFLPERSEMVFADGFEQLSQKQSTEVRLPDVSAYATSVKKAVTQTALVGLQSVLLTVQSGGNVQRVVLAFENSVRGSSCVVRGCLSQVYALHTATKAVLGAATHVGQHVDLPQTRDVLESSYDYLNTVTFGLLGRVSLRSVHFA